MKQQIISILGYAEEDNSLARAIIGSKKISSIKYLIKVKGIHTVIDFMKKKNIELYYFIFVVGMLIPREGDSIYG